jgi:hypothetical protein
VTHTHQPYRAAINGGHSASQGLRRTRPAGFSYTHNVGKAPFKLAPPGQEYQPLLSSARAPWHLIWRHLRCVALDSGQRLAPRRLGYDRHLA